MTDISQLVSIIRSAVYGKDMREAIAKSIELLGENASTTSLDDTLTKYGYAADSGAVGDKFKEVFNEIAKMESGLSREEKDVLLNFFWLLAQSNHALKEAYDAIVAIWNPAVQSISLDRTTLNLGVGMSVTLKANILPENAYNKKVIWTAQPSDVITVVNGVVIATSVGSGTITATTEDGRKTATCSVKVSAVPYYTVTNNLVLASTSNQDANVLKGSPYSAKITPDVGNVFVTVSITMANIDVTSLYFSKGTGDIYIPSVGGDITINVVCADSIRFTVDYELYQCSLSESIYSVKKDEPFSVTVNADADKILANVIVMMNGEDITYSAISNQDSNNAIIYIKRVTGNITIKADAGDMPETLNECTWTLISNMSKNGTIASYYAIGDSKTISLNGSINFKSENGNRGMILDFELENYEVEVFILGFDHNKSNEGSNLTHFQMGKKSGNRIGFCGKSSIYKDTTYTELLDTRVASTVFALSGSSEDLGSDYSAFTDPGTWSGTYLRQVVFGGSADMTAEEGERSFRKFLPADLKVVMKPVTKYTNSSDELSGANATVDYMWIPSIKEILGSGNGSEKEVQYEYYSSGNSAILNSYDQLGVSTLQCTRTASKTSEIMDSGNGWNYILENGTSVKDIRHDNFSAYGMIAVYFSPCFAV